MALSQSCMAYQYHSHQQERHESSQVCFLTNFGVECDAAIAANVTSVVKTSVSCIVGIESGYLVTVGH
jgi:hypothetical protein